MNLVTGASGIVGSHVVLQLLKKGEKVRAARRPATGTDFVRELFSYYGEERLFSLIEWIELDVADVFSVEEAVSGVDTVYHCAGKVSFSKRDRDLLFHVNEQGTANVVNACLAQKGTVLCHVSSVATINNTDSRKHITENLFWKRSGDESDYAISKYNAEREVWRGMEEGLDVVIVNPGVILSPVYWTRSSAAIFDACAGGNKFYTQGYAGYVAAPDVAAAMITAVQMKKFGERYILVAANLTYQDVLTRIQKNLGKKPPTINAGRGLLRTFMFIEGVLAFFGRRRSLERSMMQAALSREQYDGSKASAQLGLQYQNVEQFIDQVCIYYRRTRKR